MERGTVLSGLTAQGPARIAVLAFVLSTLFTLAWLVAANLASPARRYPGPWLAKYTNLWRLLAVRRGDIHVQMKALHEKYGPVVRIGPNTLDLDYPELSKVLYSTDGKWRKTEFYQNNSSIINGKITYHLFSTTDQAEHARMKRPIVKYYSQGSILAQEAMMDGVIKDLCDQLEARFMTSQNEPQACDLGEWIGFYSWDMNGVASFSQKFGYLDAGCDHDKTIEIADKALDYFAAVGQMPFLDFLLDKNPVKRIGPPNLANITRIALERLIARSTDKDTSFNPRYPDFLQHFLNAKNTHPDLVDDGIIMGYLLVNLLAGADTVAITIRAVFYFALHNPRIYRKLEAEILAAPFSAAAAAAEPVAPYTASRALPYLEAVVREAMRMHPGVCMLLERYVPPGTAAGGLPLPDGSLVAPGVAVGINPYVAGRNRDVWGEDADEFRPERWARGPHETEEEYEARLRRWNACDLTFGGGSRVCIGRNLAVVEVYKVVATLVGRYEIALVDAARQWEVTGSWFPRQKGLVCYLRKRS